MAAKKNSGVFVSWPKPTWSHIIKTNKSYKMRFHGAMLYAHYELTANELKKEVIKYLKKIDAKNPWLDRIKDIHENRFATVGKYMYILNNNGELPDDIAAGLMPAFEKIVNNEEAKKAAAEEEARYIASQAADDTKIPAAPKIVVTIQDRLREKAKEVAGEVEGWIDDFCADKKAPVKTVEDFVNLFNIYELKAAHMRHMQSIFENRTAEIANALDGSNKDLVEGYSNFTKVELKKYHTFHSNLLKACDMLQEVAKVTRAPRKKKPVSQDKLVAKLKYKKDDPALGIVSLPPVQILGSKEVWVYNTKTRKLAQYKALDERGLLVKGASLDNFSMDSAEKTLRKPADTLADFKKASKVKLRTFLKELSTVDVPANGKLNENHIILRIDK